MGFFKRFFGRLFQGSLAGTALSILTVVAAAYKQKVQDSDKDDIEKALIITAIDDFLVTLKEELGNL